MLRYPALACLTAAFLASGCATTPARPPVDVTRYHLDVADRGAISIEPVAGAGAVSPEYQTYADAVARQLSAVGFAPAPAGAPSAYVAGVSFNRTIRGEVRDRPPLTIGIGGGSFGSGGGVGGGVSVPIGRGRTHQILASQLSVQIRRRSDNTVVWEGRAQMQTIEGQADFQPVAAADRLAAALFKGFPGESGITITVK